MEGLPTETGQKEQDTSQPVIHKDQYFKDLLTVQPSTLHPVSISTRRASASATAKVPDSTKGGSAVSAWGAGIHKQSQLSYPCLQGYPLSPVLTVPAPRAPAPFPPSPPTPSPLHLLELARLAIHAGQQQPGCLADIVAVHRKAAAVASVRHGHSDPLHQRG